MTWVDWLVVLGGLAIVLAVGYILLKTFGSKTSWPHGGGGSLGSGNGQQDES